MPRTKKQIRDQLYTQAFFDQPSPSLSSHVGCAFSKLNLSVNESSQTDGDLAITKACSEFQYLTAKFEEQYLFEANHGLEKVDRLNIAGTFKLGDIGATIEHVKEVGKEFSRGLDEKFFRLRKLAAEKRMIAEGTGSHEENLRADLEEILEPCDKWTELLNFAVCTTRLFNSHKKFGFFERDCLPVRCQAEAWVGDTVKDYSLTLRQVFQDPMGLDAIMDKIETGKVREERKKRDIEVILEEKGRLSKLAVEDTQAMNQHFPHEKAKVQSLPDAFTYNDIVIPLAIPLAIRQAAFDLSFLSDDIHEMQEELSQLRETVRCTLMIWIATSNPVWEYGKEHIHEYPNLRKYEYTRTSLETSYLIAFRAEFKIVTYFASDDRPKGLCPEFEATFDKYERNPEKVRDEWDDQVKKFTQAFAPVDEIVAQMHPINQALEEEMKNDEWWVSLRPPPSKK